MSKQKVSIEKLARGALLEQFDAEFAKVLENIADVNTESKKPRKIKIELTIKPSESRQLANISFTTKSTLVPPAPVETNILIDRDNDNNIVAAEYITEIPGQAEIDMSTGEILDGVVKLKKGGKSA